MSMIETGELRTLAVDNYLTHLWRLDRIPHLERQVTKDSFYLKHFDDKGDHILVDEQYNITGIIDWEFASTESPHLAFSSPCFLLPVADFFNGSNKLSDDEMAFAAIFRQRGREDMAKMVLHGRKFQRFLYFLAGISPDRDEFEAMFQGLRESLDGPDIEPYAEWKKAAIAEAYGHDATLRKLLQAELRSSEDLVSESSLQN
jgi:hypothetical protein